MLVIRHQSESNSEAFRDFKVRRKKVAHALMWLKENNRYYIDIIIDFEVLRSLPIDGSIDDQLRSIAEESDNENEDNVITCTFVLFFPSAYREDVAIKHTLNRMQNENRPIIWPQINSNPINEFQTPGYIACAFPTLYLIGYVNLRTERIKDVKPAEYFKYLLLYKDGRFA